MKRILIIILLSFVSVVGAIGLMVGGMYLFGGFNEKNVYAEDLTFNEQEIVTDSTFFLKISTTTKEVTKTKIKLHTSVGGGRVIDFPEYATLDEYFPVIPKQVDGINYGGNVTLYASYDDEGSSQNAIAKCEILIDVPVERIENIKFAQSVVRPNQTIEIIEEDQKLIDDENEGKGVLSIFPSKSLIPYSKKIGNITDKVLILELTDGDGNEVTSSVAQFTVNGVAQNSNTVEVRYEYKNVYNSENILERRIVAKDTICVVTKNYKSDIKINAYVYSTYEAQTSRTDENEIVSIVKSDMENNSVAFAIGDYVISDFTFESLDKEVLLDLAKDSDQDDDGVSIFLNNPNCTGRDINLNIELKTDSVGINISDYYLQNMYIKINNENFGLLYNDAKADEESSNSNGVSADGWLRNKFDGISTEKEAWCWKLKLNNFLTYKNYVDNNEKLEVSLKYYDATVEEVSITKTFYIIPTVIEADSLGVRYKDESSSFSVKSGSLFEIDGNNIVRVNGQEVNSTENLNKANIFVSPNNSTFTDIEYYLSYGENYGGIKTVPSESQKTYKIKTTFKIEKQSLSNEQNQNETDKLYFQQFSAHLSWFRVENYFLKQGENIYNPNENRGVNSFDFGQDIYAEIEIKINDVLQGDVLFDATFGGTDNNEYKKEFSSFDCKFYEKTGDNTFSDIPYLFINTVRYYIDYDFYFDSVTNTDFLHLKFGINNYEGLSTENLLKLVGIGSFIVTAQLCYKYPNGDIYWLSVSKNISVDVYEELSDLKVYNDYVLDEGVYKVNPFDVNNIKYTENDTDTHYLLITSSTMQVFKNYVLYNQIEIYAYQIFYDLENNLISNSQLSEYVGIENLNRNVITFGEFVEVKNSGTTLGYRVSYQIGEVKTIVIGGNEYNPYFKVVVRALVNGEYIYASYMVKTGSGASETILEESNLVFEVEDRVFNTAMFLYKDKSDFNNIENPLEIYADLDNNGDVIYKLVSNTSAGSSDSLFKDSNDKNLTYYFAYKDGTKTTDTLSVSAMVPTGISQENLLSFATTVSGGEGKGGLTLYNFPYSENGILLTLTIQSSTMLNENSFWIWKNSQFIQEQYNLTKNLYIKVYGLKINISVKNENVEIFGKYNNDINLLGENGIFDVVVKHKKMVEDAKLNVSNYSKILGVYFDDNNNGNNLTLSADGTKVTPNVNFVEDTDVLFRFYVGSNSIGNLIMIEKNSAQQSYYIRKIKTPFVIKFDLTTNKTFTAPTDEEQRLLYLSYGDIALALNYLDDKNTEDESDDYSETRSMTASVLSHTLNANYGILNPISITTKVFTDNHYSVVLTLKAVPVSYTAIIRVRIVLTIGENSYVREEDIQISILNGFDDENLIIYSNDFGSEKYESEIADAKLKVDYCDCNVFGTVLRDGGLTTNISNHSYAEMDKSKISSFNTIAELFATFITSETFDMNNPNAWVVDSESDDYNSYNNFFNLAKSVFDASNNRITHNINYQLASSVIVGINNDFSITFASGEIPTIGDLQTVVARLFGFDSAQTFASYVNNIKNVYRQYVINDNGINEINRLKFDGAIYTANKSLILPFAFKNELSNVVCLAYVIFDSTGNVSIWINNISSALTVANFEDELTNSGLSELDVYGRCILFETPIIKAGREYNYVYGNVATNDIELVGLFGYGESSWVKKISSINILFDDGDEIEYPLAESLMKNSLFNNVNRSFMIGANDVNIEKKIVVTFTFNFVDGGMTIINKHIRISPNISLKLAFSSIEEGDKFSLNSNDTYVYKVDNNVETFDIVNMFGFNEDYVYGTGNFYFDSNVFEATQEDDFYKLYVKTTTWGVGGASACNGKTIITFDYLASNGSGRYVLKVNFELNVFFKKVDADLMVGTLDDSKCYINAGTNNEVALSGRLAEFKNNVTDVEFEFSNVSGIPDPSSTSIDSLVEGVANFSNETGKLTNIYIVCKDYNLEISLTITFRIVFANSQVVTFVRQVYLSPNIDLQISVPGASYSSGQTIGLSTLTCSFSVNGEQNSAYQSEVVSNLQVLDGGYNDQILSYDEENETFTVENGAPDGQTSFVLFYNVMEEEVIVYSMLFVVEVNISNNS